MKKIVAVLMLLLSPVVGNSQTITLNTVSKMSFCVGDPIMVSYSSSGGFGGGNVFQAQISNDSFATFTYVGNSVSQNGGMSATITSAGNYLLRVVSSNPYVTSQSVAVSSSRFPAPQPEVVSRGQYSLVAGLVGDAIPLLDAASEPSGSTFLWTFDQDASQTTSTAPSLSVSYSIEGTKTGKLQVTNALGCSSTASFSLRILTCFPRIPDNVHVVTGTESGADTSVWVKAGGSYTANGEFTRQTVFAEAGSSVTAGFRSDGTYYLIAGTSFTENASQGSAVVLLSRGSRITFDANRQTCDTFYCDNLTFDQSGSSNVATEPLQQVGFHQMLDQLNLKSNGALSVRIISLLGAEVLSERGTGELDLDLTSLPAGVYFAVVQAGDMRQVRRIAVVH